MKFSKLLKQGLLGTTIIVTMATSFQANALVSIATGPATALAGLGLIGAGFFLPLEDSGGPGVGMIAALWGIILLDGENGQELQFQPLSTAQLQNMGLTLTEANAFNSNIEELSTAFTVVTSSLDQDANSTDAAELWQEQRDILGDDAINGMKKVLAANLQK